MRALLSEFSSGGGSLLAKPLFDFGSLIRIAWTSRIPLTVAVDRPHEART